MITNDYILQEDLDNIAKEYRRQSRADSFAGQLGIQRFLLPVQLDWLDCLLYVHYLIIMIWMVQVIRS